mmetsp:Transcript_71437/g.127442  ORF Transcript_71437/g.127442 Transcript_71437/m.127442 type:complete len:347 (-) Transcript_71437:22-1062(-)
MFRRVYSWLQRWCRHRYRQCSETARTVEVPLPPLESATTPLRVQSWPITGYESDGYETCVSEVADGVGEFDLEGNTPWVSQNRATKQCQDAAPQSDDKAPECATTADELLVVLEAIERRCRSGEVPKIPLDSESRAQPLLLVEDKATVECILDEDKARFWVCRTPDCPAVTACSWFRLDGVALEHAVDAIRLPKERLAWDSESLKVLEVLGDGDIEDPNTGQIVHCVVSAPWPLQDREMLQYRWQLPLPHGGQAFVLRSFQDDSLAPPRPDRWVRAFTHLSGYLLRPLESGGGLELIVISRCDLGGVIPMRVQNLLRRFAKNQILRWVQRLQTHCEGLAARSATVT